jgi:hypothetical protein
MPQRRSNNAAVPAEVSLGMSMAAHIGWARCEDRTERTAKARNAFQQKFLDEAGGDPVKAASLRKAFYAELARKSLQTRRANAEARKGGAAA